MQHRPLQEIAARWGSKVVGIDVDPVVVGRTWRRATERGLISGDHPYRPQLWQNYLGVRTAEMVKETGMKRYPYVPFLLKLPGQHKEVDYDRAFNSTLTSDLALQLLNGRLPTTESAVAWLDTHAEMSETE
jgi:hypothetical protein